jgi:hypothetical protein
LPVELIEWVALPGLRHVELVEGFAIAGRRAYRQAPGRGWTARSGAVRRRIKGRQRCCRNSNRVAMEHGQHSPRRSGRRTILRGAMNGTRVYSYRLEGAKYGISFGSALAIAISYSNNHSVLWAIIDGILSWIYVIYFVLFR